MAKFELARNVRRIGHLDLPGGGQVVVDGGQVPLFRTPEARPGAVEEPGGPAATIPNRLLQRAQDSQSVDLGGIEQVATGTRLHVPRLSGRDPRRQVDGTGSD